MNFDNKNAIKRVTPCKFNDYNKKDKKPFHRIHCGMAVFAQVKRILFGVFFLFFTNPTKLAMKIETWFESRPDFLSLAVCEKNLFLKVRTWRKGIAEPIFVNLFGSCCRKDWEYKLWRQFLSTVSTKEILQMCKKYTCSILTFVTLTHRLQFFLRDSNFQLTTFNWESVFGNVL